MQRLYTHLYSTSQRCCACVVMSCDVDGIHIHTNPCCFCPAQAAQASGGDALVCGHSVRSPSGLSAARAVTGVCPQFDVLWPQVRHHSLMPTI
jgi:hypothetical protein